MKPIDVESMRESRLIKRGDRMAKYRKKPVVIEAIEFDETAEKIIEVKNFMNDHDVVVSFNNSARIGQLKINTLEGVMKANPGDYIIKGINGEFYPCKPDIFHKTYEKINILKGKLL